jgi:hypothetical protein
MGGRDVAGERTEVGPQRDQRSQIAEGEAGTGEHWSAIYHRIILRLFVFAFIGLQMGIVKVRR